MCETYSKFENMEPVHVWETFERDTPEEVYIDFIRNDRLVYGWTVESDDSELQILAEAIIGEGRPHCDVAMTDRPHVIEKLARHLHDALGDCASRTRLVADAIQADAREELLEFVENVNAAIDNADYASVVSVGLFNRTTLGQRVSELWDLLNGPALR